MKRLPRSVARPAADRPVRRLRRLMSVLAVPLLFLAVAAAPQAAFAQNRVTQQGPAPLFGGFQTDSNDPIEVEADQLEVTEEGKTRKTAFTGNVVVRRGTMLIKAAKLTIFSPADAEVGPGGLGQNSFDRIEASGTVTVNSGQQTATGDAAVVDMKTQKISLNGNVVLTDGTNVLSGDRLTIDLKTGQARVERGNGGRIRGVFTPNAPPGRGR